MTENRDSTRKAPNMEPTNGGQKSMRDERRNVQMLVFGVAVGSSVATAACFACAWVVLFMLRCIEVSPEDYFGLVAATTGELYPTKGPLVGGKRLLSLEGGAVPVRLKRDLGTVAIGEDRLLQMRQEVIDTMDGFISGYGDALAETDSEDRQEPTGVKNIEAWWSGYSHGSGLAEREMAAGR